VNFNKWEKRAKGNEVDCDRLNLLGGNNIVSVTF
jgi:hypothetical protein